LARRGGIAFARFLWTWRCRRRLCGVGQRFCGIGQWFGDISQGRSEIGQWFGDISRRLCGIGQWLGQRLSGRWTVRHHYRRALVGQQFQQFDESPYFWNDRTGQPRGDRIWGVVRESSRTCLRVDVRGGRPHRFAVRDATAAKKLTTGKLS
jgi:hypothetical protein